MFTKEEQRQLLRMHANVVFREDIKKHQYGDIQKLYETAGITNHMLLEQLHEHFSPMTALSEAVFMDIGYLITEMILEKPEIKALFIDAYEKRFPDAVRIATSIENALPADVEKASELFRSGLNLKKGVIGFSFQLFLIYNSDKIAESDTIPREAIEMDLEQFHKLRGSETDFNDTEMMFENDPSRPVFPSTTFDTFVGRQKKALAEYLGTTEDRLVNKISSLLAIDFRLEDFSFMTEPGEGGISHNAALGVVQSHKGGAQWVHEMIAHPKKRPGSLGYVPNIEEIIAKYYKARVTNKYMEINNLAVQKGEVPSFEKFHILRDSKAESPKEDLMAIVYLYQVDVIYKMFTVMQEEYYRDFSWEQITHKGESARYENIIRDLNSVIRKKDFQLDALSGRIDTLTAQLRQKDAKSLAEPLAFENARLLKKIEEQEQKIAELQEQIRSRDTYIEDLLTPEEELQTDTIDVSALQGKRYLFVGNAEEALPELHRLFPDSVFMPYATTKIAGVKVDAIVLLIKWTSHAMYYKIKSEASLNDVPIINVNTKNIDRLLWEMHTHMQNIS